MIRRATTLVLGAGASVPFGLPTGIRLREIICQNCVLGGSIGQQIIPLGFNAYRTSEFADEFRRSGLYSIDAFIARRPEYQTLAEHVIAGALLPLEMGDKLHKVGVTGGGDWYQFIWNLMVSETFNVDQIFDNKLRFVTFNYDRSLEFYFLEALQNTFGLNTEEAEAAVAKLGIHHVYGTLGSFRATDGVKYGASDPEAIAKAAASLKTVPSARPEVDEEGWQLIRDSQLLFFIGFGFDRVNCQRLRVADVAAEYRFASAFGLKGSEQNVIDSYASKGVPISFVQGDCLNLLREKVDCLV